MAAGGITPLEEPARSASNAALQSLPRKKDRVSRTEIAIAHEEAGAGPIASPSPRKMTDYFSPTKDDSSASGLTQSRMRSDSISDRRHSLATLQSLTELSSNPSVDSLTLTKSGLFLGVVARPLAGWTVYEDPVSASAGSDDTAPSQDHPQSLISDADASPVPTPTSSPFSSPVKSVVPSTPNKENRIPDVNFLATRVVPIALPDRAYSDNAVPTTTTPAVKTTNTSTTTTRSSSRLASAAPSPVSATTASRKRGTGGRLSLLADADADADDDTSLRADVGDETIASVGKKAKSKSTTVSPAHPRKTSSSHQRKVSAGRGSESGRTSRKGSSTYQLAGDAAATLDAVASRTSLSYAHLSLITYAYSFPVHDFQSPFRSSVMSPSVTSFTSLPPLFPVSCSRFCLCNCSASHVSSLSRHSHVHIRFCPQVLLSLYSTFQCLTNPIFRSSMQYSAFSRNIAVWFCCVLLRSALSDVGIVFPALKLIDAVLFGKWSCQIPKQPPHRGLADHLCFSPSSLDPHSDLYLFTQGESHDGAILHRRDTTGMDASLTPT